METPAIVVPAYDRPDSLRRLLGSLSRAVYPKGGIPLVISLDYTENGDCSEIAEAFEWKFGPKKVIRQPQHLGLKAHILQCGDLTGEYGSIILLEDDLLVSPYFYEYAKAALSHYSAVQEIGGISLYAYEISENGFGPFHPLADSSDVYFLQFPSSWGQAWTADQWRAFREWLKTHGEISADEKMPGFLREWPATSWKKHFARFLLAKQLFVVYPRISLSTNFSDPGTHADTASLFQVPLQLTAKTYTFPALSTSVNRYDVFFELLPEALNLLTDRFAGKSYSVDMAGRKDPEFWEGDYLLTSRRGKDVEIRFGKKMFPPVLNVIFEVEGSGLHWLPRSQVHPGTLSTASSYYRWTSLAPHLLKATPPDHVPRISLVIPVHAPLASLNLPKSPDLNLEIILVHRELEFKLPPKQSADNPPVVIQVAPESSIFHMVEKGLEAATGEVMGVLSQGAYLAKGALPQLVALFRDFDQVQWVTAQPKHAKVQKPWVSLAKQRILIEKVPHLSLSDWSQALPVGQVFWRRTLWEKTGGRFRSELSKAAFLDLWARFWKQAPPTVVKKSWSAHVLFVPELSATPDAPPDSLQHLTRNRPSPPGLLRRVLAMGFRPFFRWEVPGLRFGYYELEQLPDVLIYDPKSEKFYFWRY